METKTKVKGELDYFGAFNGSDFTIVKTEKTESGFQPKIATVHFDHSGMVEAQNQTDATRYAELFIKAPEMEKQLTQISGLNAVLLEALRLAKEYIEEPNGLVSQGWLEGIMEDAIVKAMKKP